jgi:hypothetical protein
MPWQPMTTAPKDGTEVLLTTFGTEMWDFFRYVEGHAFKDESDWMNWCGRIAEPPEHEPTHWMKIEPPNE